MTIEPEKTTDTPAESALPAATPTTDAAPPPAAAGSLTPAWLVKADYFLLALVLILSFFLGSFTAANADLWMHLTIGAQISDGTFQFGVDTFSWLTGPVGDQPAVFWVHHSWLYSWLVYQLHSSIGGEGLILFKAILFTLAIGLLSRVGWSESNRWFILICLAMAAVAMSPRLLMQPIVFSILFLSVTLFLLDRASVFSYPEEGASPPDTRWLWGLPVVFGVWANFDSWFILGPIVLGVCWAARGLATRFPGVSAVPGQTLAQVFAVGLLACLANPFHVRVFQLPAELAYIGVTVGQSIGLTLPDAIFAAGKTLRAFQRAEVGQSPVLSAWALSPLAPMYWKNQSLGLNIAGLAYVPLMLLGLISFTLSAYVPAEKKAPTLHLNRFLLWLLLALLALVLHRVIVFWALLAAPLTAMTLGDFLTWQHKVSAVAFDNRRRALQSARLLSVPFFLLLLYFAWPGWLQGTMDTYSSPRRVAWGLRLDPSLDRAMASLNDIAPIDDNSHLFNVSLGVGDAASAAKRKHAIDSRLALFSRDAKAFLDARAALMDKEKPSEAWSEQFTRHGVRHVVFTNLTNDRVMVRFQFLLNANEWRIRFGDNRHLVFSWAGPDQSWPANTVIDDLNRQAFGEVPAAHRPAPEGAGNVLPRDWLTPYLEGVGSQPTSIGEISLLQGRYQLARDLNERAMIPVISLMNAGPGPRPSFAQSLRSGFYMVKYLPQDHSLAAMPVLAMRAARRAVAENPRDATAHFALFEANNFLREKTEDAWTLQSGPPGPRHPSRLRNRIRQLMAVTAIHNAVQLEPENLELNNLLSRILEHDNLYDSSLRFLQKSETLLPAAMAKAIPPLSTKDRDANLKGFREMVGPRENDIMQRRAKFKEIDGDPDKLKKADFALNSPYEELREKDRVQSRLGLADKALELLEALKEGELDGERRSIHSRIYLDLLLRLGRANEVNESLKKSENKQGPLLKMFAEFRLQAAVAVGDYTGAQEALGLMEAELIQIAEESRTAARSVAIRVIGIPLLAPIVDSASPSTTVAAVLIKTGALPGLFNQLNQVALIRNELCNVVTLRGILALEAGDTVAARAYFEQALAEAGRDFGFSDRPIAERYLELLKSAR